MKRLFEALSSLIGGSQRQRMSGRFITIGNDTFAVARSRKEMAAAMKMKNKYITGYLYSHHM